MAAPELNLNFLAKNLRFLRKKLKISQEQLSQDLEVTRNKIASYESRNIEPKLELIAKIANYFNITIDDLIITEITDENYDALINKKSHTAHSDDASFELTMDLKKRNAISDFIEENVKIGKIINGFKAFREIKHHNNQESSELDQIMEVMEYLMDTNKNLILEINSTIDKINEE